MYKVYYAVVNVLGNDDETKVFRFIIFENGTTFEFYGMHGSLRYGACIKDDDVAQLKQIQLYHDESTAPQQQQQQQQDKNLTTQDNTTLFERNRDIMYNVLQNTEGLLSQYIREKEHIIECGRMTTRQGRAFAQSMKCVTHPYASSKATEVFKAYLNEL